MVVPDAISVAAREELPVARVGAAEARALDLGLAMARAGHDEPIADLARLIWVKEPPGCAHYAGTAWRRWRPTGISITRRRTV
jgi:hypothetical protein